MEKKPDQINLPDVEDIPGQEHVSPAPLGELADVTASSDDEEGKETLDEDTVIAGENNVTDEERELLDDAANTDPAYEEERNVKQASVDMVDDDGEPLNDEGDLDVPGAELDDDAEEIGEEDEENNTYSLNDDED